MSKCADCQSLFGHMPWCPSSGKAVATMEREGLTVPAGMTEPGKIEEYRRGGADDLPPESLVELRKLRAEFQEAQRRIPRIADFAVSGAFPASGNLLLVPRPGGPSRGRRWHLRALRFSAGSTATQADTALLYVYVGIEPNSAASADLNYTYRDGAVTSTPVPAFYSDYEVVVREGQRLYFLITGGTSGRTYVVTGTAKDEIEALAAPEAYEI